MKSTDYEETSNPDRTYNCVAWAAGQDDVWWEPLWPVDLGYFWPAGAGIMGTTSSLVQAFQTLGYERCSDGSLDATVEKVVLYEDQSGDYTHAARQILDGRWASKIGAHQDITHLAPENLCGSEYGKIALYMSRPRPK